MTDPVYTSSLTPPNWRKLCEELVEASGNAGRMDGLASWEYLLDRTRTLLAQSGPDPYKEEIDCETCEGLGTIDERLGGYGDSNPAATCPDCDGTGVIVVSAPSPEKGLSDNDLIAAATEAGLCYPWYWDFTSQPERLEHLRAFANSIIARCGNHFPDAKKMVGPASTGWVLMPPSLESGSTVEEVAELVTALRQVSDGANACGDEGTSWITARAANLIESILLHQR